MEKPSLLLRRRHSVICEKLSVSDSTFRALAGRLFSANIIDMTTKAAVLRKLGHEGADSLMDMLEMKVESRPERLDTILKIMIEFEILREIFDDLIERTEPSPGPTTVQPIPEVRHTHAGVTVSNYTNNTFPIPPITNTHSSQRNLDQDTISKLKETISKTIEQLYSKLCSAIGQEALPDLIRTLYQEGLVGKELLTAPDYDNMMKSFLSTLDWDSSVDDLEKDCCKFIKALDKIGGPSRKASERISSDWKQAVRQNFGFDFKTP